MLAAILAFGSALVPLALAVLKLFEARSASAPDNATLDEAVQARRIADDVATQDMPTLLADYKRMHSSGGK